LDFETDVLETFWQYKLYFSAVSAHSALSTLPGGGSDRTLATPYKWAAPKILKFAKIHTFSELIHTRFVRTLRGFPKFSYIFRAYHFFCGRGRKACFFFS
jgi:hypothetical protein